MEHKIFVCSCTEVGHQVVISRFEDEPETYISIGIVDNLPFFKRLKLAYLLLIGRKIEGNPYYHEVILPPEGCKAMAEHLMRGS